MIMGPVGTKVMGSLQALMWCGANKRRLMAKRGGVGWLGGAGMSKEVELHTITLSVLAQL